jgi:hypothetical protein
MTLVPSIVVESSQKKAAIVVCDKETDNYFDGVIVFQNKTLIFHFTV